MLWLQAESAAEVNLLPDIPSPGRLREVLLPAYTAPWLGLVPEQAPAGPAAAAAPASAAKPRSLIRQPVGSRLPTPRVRPSVEEMSQIIMQVSWCIKSPLLAILVAS